MNEHKQYEGRLPNSTVESKKEGLEYGLEKIKYFVLYAFITLVSLIIAFALIVLSMHYLFPEKYNGWQLSDMQIKTIQNFTFSGALTYFATNFSKKVLGSNK